MTKIGQLASSGLKILLGACIALNLVSCASIGAFWSPESNQSSAGAQSEQSGVSAASGGQSADADQSGRSDRVAVTLTDEEVDELYNLEKGYEKGPDGKLLPPKPPAKVEMPEEAKEYSAEGAAAFSFYFLQLMSYSWLSGDTADLAAASSEKCAVCQGTIDLVRQTYDQGGWSDNWYIDVVRRYRPTPIEGRVGCYFSVIEYDVRGGYYYDRDTKTLGETEGRKCRLFMNSCYMDRKWVADWVSDEPRED